MTVFSLLLISLSLGLKIYSSKASPRTFFVKTNQCSGDSHPCDGSLENPFPDLFLALKELERSWEAERMSEIVLKLKDASIQVPEAPEHTKFFSSNERINITICPDETVSRTKITFSKSAPFSFLIRGGNLFFINIDFEGNTQRFFIEYEYSGSQANVLSLAFLNLQPVSDINLRLINTSFSGIFLNMKDVKGHAFSSLIYVDTYSQAGAINHVEILIENLKVFNTHYPQGLLYSNAIINPGDQLNKSVAINCLNLAVVNYTNKYFLHWKTAYLMEKTTNDYFDFLFIVNNTDLFIKNLDITNSSRIILANSNNKLALENFTIFFPFDVEVLEKSPPEMIYLIKSNKINADGINIINTTIYSYDDMIEPNNRDYSILNASMMPATLLRMEKNQALFGFVLNNSGTINNVLIKNSFFYKRENYLLSVFGLEYKNKLLMTNVTVDTVTLDTESRIGFVCVFQLASANEVHIYLGYVADLSIYGYANAIFGNLVAGNTFNSSSVIYLRNYFKTKSNRGQLNNWLDGMNTNPGLAFSNKSASFKSAGLYLILILNNFFADNNQANDTMCLYGCFVGVLLRNNLVLSKIVIKQAASEVMSSVVVLGLYNTFKGTNLAIDGCRANSGVIYARTSNVVTLEYGQFSSNWGMGGFGLRQYHVSGNLGVSIENKLFMKSCFITNGYADITAGGLYLREKNSVEIDLCIFIENESSSAFSTGGGIFAYSMNTIKMRNTRFLNNYGTTGGGSLRR